ncbi:TetR/AcrR family transcriptional regulator [Xanthomonas hortorum]|uniref:TetR/AcrR family transcriptional regulator n=1 Tax=Xanthomonas hortorum pv. hederae TaxID=453603 RepID=A0A9X3YYU1_9XANT|nr:TetR/AcrR family transcriptional regulator [Xanthomonas hortorum]MCE4369639.1 TetR/AcrR family transcriptional regulator [Xanthomonas hortorum pv. hederae]MDC8637137.1 TetR/AcrR family transcriptional regulator [Xanthomonas hortorum pv. hederae]PPU86182.1 hypothetical protein XhhCFBP4925_00160 [Xanthomonas hortorum pv. hederae]PUF01246.1 TetR/AcrR family transcriptional regulator [Xanthomonas hortorum pv. hederae]
MKPSAKPAARKRVRLKPEIRSQQILDAALIQFSQHGFAATRIEDIARGAGLSKAGVYAHFAGKEEIFEALLARTLTPQMSSLVLAPLPEGEVGPEYVQARAEFFIDQLYEKLTDPGVTAMLRLLITESARVPHLIAGWRRDMVLPYLEKQEQIMAQALQRGLVPRNALTENFATLLYSPAAHAILQHVVFRQGPAGREIAAMKELHRRMLLEWAQLDPSPRPDPTTGQDAPDGTGVTG